MASTQVAGVEKPANRQLVSIPRLKCSPLTVTTVPPLSAGPSTGHIEVTVGAGSNEYRTSEKE